MTCGTKAGECRTYASTSELQPRSHAASLRLSSRAGLKKEPIEQRTTSKGRTVYIFPKWPRTKREPQTEGGGEERRAEGGSIYRCSQRAPAQLVMVKTAGIIRRPFPRFFRPQPERAQKRWIPTQICCCRTVGHSRLQRAARRETITVFFIQHSSFIQTRVFPS